MLGRRNLMLDIPPPVIHRTTRDLDNFSLGDDSEDPSNELIVWEPDDKVYHDDTLLYSMLGPRSGKLTVSLINICICRKTEAD
jgi:hypothetical protein